MDFLIIMLTILGAFILFVALYFGAAMVFPRVKDSLENYRSQMRKRESLPGSGRNPYSFPVTKK